MGKNNMQGELKTISDPKYRGRHLVMIAGKVFMAKTGQQAAKLFDKVTKKYAGQTPTITYVPKAETLILFYGMEFQKSKFQPLKIVSSVLPKAIFL